MDQTCTYCISSRPSWTDDVKGRRALANHQISCKAAKRATSATLDRMSKGEVIVAVPPVAAAAEAAAAATPEAATAAEAATI